MGKDIQPLVAESLSNNPWELITLRMHSDIFLVDSQNTKVGNTYIICPILFHVCLLNVHLWSCVYILDRDFVRQGIPQG